MCESAVQVASVLKEQPPSINQCYENETLNSANSKESGGRNRGKHFGFHYHLTLWTPVGYDTINNNSNQKLLWYVQAILFMLQ